MNLNEHKAAFIKSLIGDMQKLDPKKSFRQCWDLLQRQRPDLFQESSDEFGAVRQPHIPEGVVSQPISSAAALRAKLGTRLPVKVQAESSVDPNSIELRSADVDALVTLVEWCKK
jgi:hypothetical protein